MRPTVEYSRDPIRPPSPESVAGTELDYRTEPCPHGERVRLTAYFIGRHIIFFLVIVAALRATSVALWVPFLFPLVILVLFAAALRLMLRMAPWSSIIKCATFGFAWWGMTIVTNRLFSASFAAVMMFLLAMLIAAVLADSLATHHASWMAANPMLPRDARRRWRSYWHRRFQRLADRLPAALRVVADGRRAIPELDLYAGGFIIVFAACVVGVIVFALAQGSLFPGMTAVLATLAVLGIGGITWNLFGQRDRRAPLWALGRALVSWYTYNLHGTEAAGVFRSPRGSYEARTWATLAVGSLLAASLMPLASFFPLPFYTVDAEWLRENTTFRWKVPFMQSSARSDRDAEPPTRQQMLAGLEPHRRTYYDSLEPSLQAKYLDHLSRLHGEASVELERAAEAEQFRQRFAAFPEAWIPVAFQGVFTGDPFFIWTITLSLLLSLLVPPVMLFLVCYTVCGRVLVCYYNALEAPDAPEQAKDRSLWDMRVQRIHESAHELEREHIWLGCNAINDYPVLMHRRMLKEHAHILGDSGSGKTSIGLLSPMVQMMRARDSSIVVIDLKGEEALFHAVRDESIKAGLPFKWFTTDHRRSTFIYNPLSQSYGAHLTINQRVQILLQAMGLEYGEFYGKGYFSAVQENVLKRVLKTFANDIHCFKDIARCVESKDLYRATGSRSQGSARFHEMQDAGHLVAAVHRLADVVPLNVTHKSAPSPEAMNAAIDMPDVVARPQVVYFFLPSGLEPVSHRGIAKLALYGLLASAYLKRDPYRRTANNGEHQSKGVYVFIDEFQEIVSHNLQRVMAEARSFDIGVILANQNISDLTTPDVDLVPVVQGNTAFKQTFRATSFPQQDALVRASGEMMYEMINRSYGGDDGETLMSYQEVQHIGPRYRPNDVILMSAEDQHNIVQFSKNSGFTRFSAFPFEIISDHLVSEATFHERRDKLPWPDDPDNALPHGFTIPDTSSLGGLGEDGPDDVQAGATPAPRPSTADETAFEAELAAYQAEQKEKTKRLHDSADRKNVRKDPPS